MAKHVLSVGFVFPGDICEFVPLNSTRSLLDADVVIFRPSVAPFRFTEYRDSNWQGKPNLADNASFQLKSAANHWNQQLRMAINAGKTVFVFLTALEEVWVDTGQRTYSETSGNQRTTRHVSAFNNYDMLPAFSDKVISAEGTQMRRTDRAAFLTGYWRQFEQHSAYKVMFEGLKGVSIITTSSGNMPVGSHFTFTGAKGRVVALPALRQYDLEANELRGKWHNLGGKWNRADKVFGHRLLGALLAIDDTLRDDLSASTPPAWANVDEYVLPRERELNGALLNADAEIEASLSRKAQLSKVLADEGVLRRLLYEQGSALEVAILGALNVLGFTAEPFKNAESEFDAVFVCSEGRFIGEAEGKDSKAINIDKLRQLEMNLQEDLAREEVTEKAKGVLFGNAFRLQSLNERPKQYFTDKCLTSAVRTQTALVRTPDLFMAAKYVKETGDIAYAVMCRKAIVEHGGKVVVFPAPPPQATSSSTKSSG